jgi:RNA polymerase sigma-70 factor (ECF subfamily)
VTASRSEDILTRAQRGDHAAFAEIVREHQSMIFGIVRRFVGDAGVAEELAQEVFLDLYQNLAAIASADHLRFWLRRVASHRCIDHARRRKVRPTVCLDEVPEPAARSASGDPILAGTLRRYVGALPETARMIVVLRYQEDLAPAEIAEVLDMPVNTVKSHLQRSLAILREKLARCLGEVQV